MLKSKIRLVFLITFFTLIVNALMVFIAVVRKEDPAALAFKTSTFIFCMTSLAVIMVISGMVLMRMRVGKSREFQKGIHADLRDKLRLQTEELRASENLNRSLFDNMMHGFIYCEVVFDHHRKAVDYIYLASNEKYSELTGLRNLLGKRLSEVVPGLLEADPGLFATIGRVSTTGVAERFQIFVQALEKWYSVSMYCPHHGHFVALVDDLSHEKATEARLVDSEKRFRSLMEHASDAVFLVDEKMHIVYQTPSTERVTGFTLAERQAHPALFYMHPDDLAYAQDVMERSKRQPGVHVPFDCRLLRANKTYVRVEGTVTNLCEVHGVNAFVVNCREAIDKQG